MDAQLEIIALSPQGFADPRLAAAAARGGFRGGLSLEELSAAQIQPHLEQLSWTDGRYCLALGRLDDALLALLRQYRLWLQAIILCDSESDRLPSDVSALVAIGIDVLVQATSVEQAEQGVRAGAHGIVLKGNEAGGVVGEETSFILLQRARARVNQPLWVRGGVGLYTAAACLAGGATGVVLDWQLALAHESSLPPDIQAFVRRTDGSETAILGQDCPVRFRAYSAPGEAAFAALRDFEARRSLDHSADAALLGEWRKQLNSAVNGEGSSRLLAMGQDAAFAAPLAQKYGSVAGICGAIRREARRQCHIAARDNALRAGGPLAESHSTQYPILQGPMTRVSDVADFALAVAEGGALPFLALALLKGPQVGKLLDETKTKLADRPWGVGILGFVPKELRDEQLAEVRRHPPPFAIIAGGRPDQAAALERDGIRTYLHVPSPGLLKIFLENGARRVIFEGRECGGHVGPRSSFVLWSVMIDALLEHLTKTNAAAEDFHVVFAGGIHDATSAAMVMALAAPLTERGVRVGVLIGTAYLFTSEAVDSGAIVPAFQAEAIRCEQTILLESGVGHATRCADTPFGEQFNAEKRRLQREELPAEQIRVRLDALNLGRLRIASKAVQRDEQSGKGERKFVGLDEPVQRREGMYMIGQVAALRSTRCTIAELHADVADGARVLERFVATAPPRPMSGPCDVAIVGMSCMLPQAGDARRFWDNVLNRVNAIREVPADQWEVGRYFDADRRARDKIYSRWGGFLDAVAFDPMKFGMPPNSVKSVEPVQLLVLEAVRAALADAGYADKPFDREHTSVIIGAGGGVGNVGLGYGFRSMLPHYLGMVEGEKQDAADLIDRLEGQLPEWTEDSFAGLLLNVIAGRVANRFDLGGTNYTVDAACASSLAAVRLAVNELQAGSSNIVLVGGADTMQSPFAYLCFSKTQALSPSGQCRTFDEASDGIVISEGVVMLVLKRLADAERDGDRVYAVIKGVGSSSDGRDKGLTAPRPEGQMRALERAYLQAGVSPQTVGLVEAHGTGTVAGDKSEVESLTRMFRGVGAGVQTCALGSVKSMIGHTKCTAGVAGLMKAALAVHHKVLPATIGVAKPNPKANFGTSPFYVNSETRPWLARADGAPRRAGVSAFGFGGTNFHAVLEEAEPAGATADATPGSRDWPAELFIWRGASADSIRTRLKALTTALNDGATPRLVDLAAAVCREDGRASGTCVLAIVAESLDVLRERLAKADAALASGGSTHRDPTGVYFVANAPDVTGKVAFLFPGQGSQRVNMLRDLALAMPRIREVFEHADIALGDTLGAPLSSYVFPKPAFTDEERAAQETALTHTRIAQPAMGAADLAMFRLLSDLGITADFFAGHSYGEYAALAAAGAMSLADLIRVSEARGRLLAEAAAAAPGTMAAIDLDETQTAALLEGIADVSIANLNSPAQTVVSGTPDGIAKALERCTAKNINGRPIKVSAAFHSPLMASAQAPFRAALDSATIAATRRQVFANLTAAPHGTEPSGIKDALVAHLTSPVRFAAELRALHAAGARLFIEVGPGRTLSGLLEKSLTGLEYSAITLDQGGRNGIVQLAHALASLALAGARFDAAALYTGRIESAPPLAALLEQTRKQAPAATTWMLYGNRAVPLKPPAAKAAAPKPAEKETAKTQTTPQITSAAPVVPVADSSSIKGMPVMHTNAPPEAALPSAPPTSGTPAPPGVPATMAVSYAPPATAEGVDAVMAAHHQFMSRFIEAHKSIMLAYLQGAPAADSVPAMPQYAPPTPMPAAPRLEIRPSPAPAVTNGAGQHYAPPAPVAAKPAPVQAAPSNGNGNGNGDVHVPAPAATAAPVAEPAANTGLTRDDLLKHLTRVVSDRTGYPADMLGLDMDLEADLGIDSIKRIEILGTLQNEGILPAASAGGDMEVLSKLNSLRAIADWFEQQAAASGGGVAASAAAHSHGSNGNGDAVAEPAPRMRLEVADAPFRLAPVRPAPDGLVLITDDGAGIADQLAAKLRAEGAHAEIIAVRGSVGDLADPAAAQVLVQSIQREHGRVAVLVHLAALGIPQDLPTSPAAWDDALAVSLHSFFNLAKLLEADLRSAKGRVLAATRLGGTFLADANAQTVWPGGGAVAGLAKTIAREWSEVSSKTVDFDASADAATIASALFDELGVADGLFEVGYSAGRRVTIRPVAAALTPRTSDFSLDRDAVVLVTGGARGITAEVTRTLAQRFGGTYILAGRTPLPGEEPATTAGLVEPRDLKAVIRQQIETCGEKATPATIEAAYRRLMAAREIRNSLQQILQAGARVTYVEVDVTDAAAFAAAIDGIYARHGRLDGVIHGAGVIEDKLIRDKSLASLQRVLAPKVTGAAVLAAKLRPESLKFLAFFTSVSGRYGNRGQADYAAANEVLNKLAATLNARWAARVVAFNWGPWESTGGMVSAELAKQFAAAGVHVLSRPQGCKAFIDELMHGDKRDVEVIFGGPLRLADAPAQTESVAATDAPIRPLLAANVRKRTESATSLEITRTLDPAQDLYLLDHRLDGKPVMPMAIGLELFAECAASLRPGLQLAAMRDHRVMRGIALDNRPEDLHVVATIQREDADSAEIALTLRVGDGRDTRYAATAELRKVLPAAPDVAPTPITDAAPLACTIAAAYQDWLFHGPIFAGIEEVFGVSASGIVGRLAPSSPQRCLAECPPSSWLIDPVIVDSGLQLIILWARTNLDMTPLPARLGSYRRFGGPFVGPVHAECGIRHIVGNPNIVVEIRFRDAAGKLVGWIENLEATCSRALNRLAGSRVGAA
jgi:acyl transferase domain-containing protein/NAD(P)H-dependent flavin oxidoreductase YrpB (nitropropane dioxygenase family)